MPRLRPQAVAPSEQQGLCQPCDTKPLRPQAALPQRVRGFELARLPVEDKVATPAARRDSDIPDTRRGHDSFPVTAELG